MIPSSSALEAEVYDFHAEDEELESILVCRRLLLDAGCDPTIPVVINFGDGAVEMLDSFGSILSDGVPVRWLC